jgi:hypothetical protein
VTEELDRAVRTVLRDCLKVEPGEDVLIVCNPVTEELGSLMRIQAQGDGAEATMAVIAERGLEGRAGEGPPSWTDDFERPGSHGRLGNCLPAAREGRGGRCGSLARTSPFGLLTTATAVALRRVGANEADSRAERLGEG